MRINCKKKRNKHTVQCTDIAEVTNSAATPSTQIVCTEIAFAEKERSE